MNATSMSIKPENLKSLLESLDEKFPKQIFPSESLANIITNWGTSDAIKAQCEHMAMGLHTGELFQVPKPVNDSLLKQALVRIRYGRSGILQVHSKKRPEIALDTIKLDAAKLAKHLHLDNEIVVEKLGESTFKLSVTK